MQTNKANQHEMTEPGTLKRHREMYARRLLEIERTEGLSVRELLDRANRPANFHRTCIEDSEPEAAANK